MKPEMTKKRSTPASPSESSSVMAVRIAERLRIEQAVMASDHAIAAIARSTWTDAIAA